MVTKTGAVTSEKTYSDNMNEKSFIGAKVTNYLTNHLMKTAHPDVFSIGDVTGIPLAVGKPLPKAGVFAHYQAEVIANNIAVAVNGKGKLKTFTGNGECFIEMGGGKAGFAKGNFFAEPLPKIKMYKPGIHWHVGKVLFEKDFLRRWF